MIKKIVKKIVNIFGFDIRRAESHDRKTVDGVLRHIASIWRPDIIIDVGAAYGSFVHLSQDIFPNASFVTVEPLYEYERALAKLPRVIHKIFAAAGSSKQEKTIYVHQDLVGSSTKQEVDGEKVDGIKRIVLVTTVDSIVEEFDLKGKILLKVDVQGAELDVLEGALHSFGRIDCVVLEVSFFRSMIDGADIYDIITYMKDQGFVLYDIASCLYRPYDGALSQCDAVFVKEHGLFREYQGFATEEQREKQNEQFHKKLTDVL